MSRSKESGFTVVELMISLFIAAAFVASGYQLYTVIVRDSAEARQQSLASNLAYSYLRRESSIIPGTCTGAGSPVVTYDTPANTRLFNPSVIIKKFTRGSCPYANGGMQVEVTVEYGEASTRKDVTHVLFTTP